MSKHKEPKPLKPYKSLKQMQKARIADKMYRVTLRFHLEHGRMPADRELEALAQTVYAMAVSLRVECEEILRLFIKRQEKYEQRILKDIENGITLESLNKPKKSEKPKNAVKKKRHKKKTKKKESFEEAWQDDRFFFIAGYTSGGAPYGVTWDEMGLEPWQSISDLDS